MNYREALEYFRDRSDYDRGFVSNPFAGDDAAAAGLRRTRIVVDALGSPDRAYPIIHIAGTKGKGSTCAVIESLARHAGLRTGLFVTPHLHTVRERIQIDAAPVSEAEWAAATDQVARAVAAVEADHPDLGRVTAFELNTALALLLFERAAVDLGIVEVGLGGRLDATNVVEPVVTAITPISFDHQAILGDTLEAIASEKAGIIKPGIPVVVAPQEPSAGDAIARRAVVQEAPLLRAGHDWQFQAEDGSVSFSGPWGSLSGVKLGLRGKHQADNAGAALMALWQWSPGLFANSRALRAGLEAVLWIGRFEVVHDAPTVVFDGAHNGASVEVLAQTLRDEYPEREYIVVFGSYRDKDLPAMLGALAPLKPRVVATRSTSPRAQDPDVICAAANKLGLQARVATTVPAAVRHALDSADRNTVIVATGSLSVVAETREHFGLAQVSELEREILSG